MKSAFDLRSSRFGTTTLRKLDYPVPHAHYESDEAFIVFEGSLIVEVEGERFTVGPREFCCFPQGVYHSVSKSILL